MSNRYLPEGSLLDTPENKTACASVSALRIAMEHETILEGRAILCTAEHDLLIHVGNYTGIIKREDTALGIQEGTTKEIAILSRVGKPISFTIISIDQDGAQPLLRLSRRRAQELAVQYFMEQVSPGTVIPAKITHMENFGAFVDIGCGFVSMIGIENISVSRISHPSRRFLPGQKIYAVVTGVDPQLNRVYLSHRELLGTWEENAAQFTPGMTVAGYVRGIKDYGTFIELTPNLTGLADLTEGLWEDERVSVFIKAIIPDRMKIKLMVIQPLESLSTPPPLPYQITSGKLTYWRYSPESCTRSRLETAFDQPSDFSEPQ